MLKVSEVTVRRWIRDGELRAIDIGKGWRVGTNDLGAFLRAHETRPAAPSVAQYPPGAEAERTERT